MSLFLTRILSIYLAFIMLVSSVGVNIVEHFCSEKNHTTISLFADSSCSDEVAEEESCCAEKDNTQDIEMLSCSDCCTNTHHFEKVEISTLVVQTVDFNVDISSLITLLPFNNETFKINNLAGKIISNYIPPDIYSSTDIQSEYQIYLC